ncbi:class I SAM-dependent methyltransferase [Herbaspirillum sp. NPDC087042]|uniref:class I SAM-dependent methyltransferase n=1 Tax=Herbaspirillum sp. NPDC087042 TaxID=3364004 RepID=UPI0038270DB2
MDIPLSLLKHCRQIKSAAHRLLSRLGLVRDVSAHYVRIDGGAALSESARLRGAWQSELLPARQRELVDRQLLSYRDGVAVEVFDVLVDALRALPENPAGKTLLEIGCSSGFYSEVLEIAGIGVRYSGCDYSTPFIELAQKIYPAMRFSVEDATSLRQADGEFDIVLSGCCLLHIPEYGKAVLETARVCTGYAIFHRTPVVLDQPDVYYRKQAYGVETVEIHFNEQQFLGLLEDSGLRLIATYTLSESIREGKREATRTYVCQKK